MMEEPAHPITRTTDDGRLARGRRLFEYHCYEAEDSSDATLWHHTHQQIVVLAKTGDPNWLAKDGRMQWEERCYQIRFECGFVAGVFDDELLTHAREYERDSYDGGQPCHDRKEGQE